MNGNPGHACSTPKMIEYAVDFIRVSDAWAVLEAVGQGDQGLKPIRWTLHATGKKARRYCYLPSKGNIDAERKGYIRYIRKALVTKKVFNNLQLSGFLTGKTKRLPNCVDGNNVVENLLSDIEILALCGDKE